MGRGRWDSWLTLQSSHMVWLWGGQYLKHAAGDMWGIPGNEGFPSHGGGNRCNFIRYQILSLYLCCFGSHWSCRSDVITDSVGPGRSDLDQPKLQFCFIHHFCLSSNFGLTRFFLANRLTKKRLKHPYWPNPNAFKPCGHRKTFFCYQSQQKLQPKTNTKQRSIPPHSWSYL